MEKDHLPLKVDPFRLAEHGASLHGVLPLKNMSRLCENISEQEGNVTVDMTFGVDEQGTRFIKGNLATHITLQCQRCMEFFPYEITSNFILGVVQSEEQADQLPTLYDAVLVKDGELFPSEMIEDELIVNMPIVPMHERSVCQIKFPSVPDFDAIKESPFKVIELLRKRNNSKQ